jgi:hypothetical protein
MPLDVKKLREAVEAMPSTFQRQSLSYYCHPNDYAKVGDCVGGIRIVPSPWGPELLADFEPGDEARKALMLGWSGMGGPMPPMGTVRAALDDKTCDACRATHGSYDMAPNLDCTSEHGCRCIVEDEDGSTVD